MHERSLLSLPLTFSSVYLCVDCVSGVLEILFLGEGLVFDQMSEGRKEGKTARGFYSLSFACFLLAKKLKVTQRLIRFLFGNRPYVTDFSMLNQ